MAMHKKNDLKGKFTVS